MIGIILLCVLAVIVVVSISLFLYEAKHAPLIDDSQPFLHDEFDDVNNHCEVFCKNCIFFDKIAMCLHGDNLGQIDFHTIHKCNKESLFKPE
jgi:hypothetical protein